MGTAVEGQRLQLDTLPKGLGPALLSNDKEMAATHMQQYQQLPLQLQLRLRPSHANKVAEFPLKASDAALCFDRAGFDITGNSLCSSPRWPIYDNRSSQLRPNLMCTNPLVASPFGSGTLSMGVHGYRPDVA
jgi:hypothetical protein